MLLQKQTVCYDIQTNEAEKKLKIKLAKHDVQKLTLIQITVNSY